MHRLLVLSLLIFAADCTAAKLHYRVSLAETPPPNLEKFKVDACFEEGLPERLEAGSSEAKRQLKGLRIDGENIEAKFKGRALLLPRGKTKCVELFMDVSNASSLRRAAPDPEFRLIDNRQWLWQPAACDQGCDMEIEFAMPEGVSVAGPWKLIRASKNNTRYHYTGKPSGWSSLLLLGRFESSQVQVAGGQIRVAMPGFSARQQAKLLAWIERGASALASVYGELPVDFLQVTVLNAGPASEPVPWGEIKRGGAPAMLLLVDPSQSVDAFNNDWTLFHELSHLLLPYVSRRDAWLSEGLASYYQNLAPAMAGIYSEQQLWEKLLAGFARGERDTDSRYSLQQATREMRNQHSYRRVYWSGAAILFRADVALRRASEGRQSLATVLKQLRKCCMPSEGYWRAKTLLTKLDELSGTEVFTQAAISELGSRDFPDVSASLEWLGVSSQGENIVLQNNAPGAAIRQGFAGKDE